MRPRARANLRANTNRGNVHCKQNCFRGVLPFKTLFAEFCVKSGRKTEPWNWAVRPISPNLPHIIQEIQASAESHFRKILPHLYVASVNESPD